METSQHVKWSTALAIRGTFLLSLLCLGFAAEQYQARGGMPLTAGSAGPLTVVFWLLTLVALGCGFLMPRWLAKTRNHRRPPRGLLCSQISQGACFEVAAIQGLLLSMLIGRWETSLPFLAAAGFAMVVSTPTKAEWQNGATSSRRSTTTRDHRDL